MLDLEKLEEIAKRATPGPWVHGTPMENWKEFVYLQNVYTKGGDDVVEMANNSFVIRRTDADFITEFNPTVALELIKRIRKLESAFNKISERPCQCKQSYECDCGMRHRQIAEAALGKDTL